jgi:hypothetical protein
LGAGVMVASWGFLIGAVSMPVCCVVRRIFPGRCRCLRFRLLA